MNRSDSETYLNEFIEYFGSAAPGSDPSVCAALVLEQVFGIRLTDEDLTWDRLGSPEYVRGLIDGTMRQENICAASAE